MYDAQLIYVSLRFRYLSNHSYKSGKSKIVLFSEVKLSMSDHLNPRITQGFGKDFGRLSGKEVVHEVIAHTVRSKGRAR